MTVQLIRGTALEVLRGLPDASVDAIVTDPPYGLSKEPDPADVLRHWLNGDDYTHQGGGFMGKTWDSFVPGPSVWRECLRVLRPGGHLLCFAGSRTVDLMGMAIRLGGFEIRDQIQWLYGSGFPKSMDVAKALDKAGPVDAERWQGWGTALKPAHEPIIVARKPLVGTVANNVLTHGTGALNIDATRIAANAEALGRWPANVIFTHHEDCIEVGTTVVKGDSRAGMDPGSRKGGFYDPGSDKGDIKPNGTLHGDSVQPVFDCHDDCAVRRLDAQSGTSKSTGGRGAASGRIDNPGIYGSFSGENPGSSAGGYGDTGGASRFFYQAKASKAERNAGLPDGQVNTHPTVKPLALMEYLVKLVTPPGGTVLDPYVGSGTTMVAAVRCGMGGIGIDRDDENAYLDIAKHRIEWANSERIIDQRQLVAAPAVNTYGDDEPF